MFFVDFICGAVIVTYFVVDMYFALSQIFWRMKVFV